MAVHAALVFLAFVVSTSSTAQTTNYLREAYPLCFELFQDETSEEHKICVEHQARRPSGWTRENTQAMVKEELDRRKRALDADRQLKANREASNNPDLLEFKGMALGMDLATIEATGRFYCRAPTSSQSDQVCSLKYGQHEKIAAAPNKVIALFFYSGRLEQILISFDAENFSSVEAALGEKYGKGTISTETLTNRMGATFENRKVVWRRGKAAVRAERHAGQADRSMVTYQTDFGVEENARRRNSSTKSKAKDL
jgi:hypothetical protein